jgi:alkylhydroperoxidase family enzyme
MYPRKLRIRPLEPSEYDDEVRAVLPAPSGKGGVLNIFATLARHPKLLKRWLVFGGHVLGKSTLSPRARELIILRTGYRCKSEYEWGQHVLIARQVGISDAEILRVVAGPDATGWDPFEVLLLQAADELHDEQTISNGTWDGLAEKYNVQQMMDVVFTIGQYTLVSMALNAFGVQRDEGVEGFPE